MTYNNKYNFYLHRHILRFQPTLKKIKVVYTYV